jgi:DNA topoisomerase III
MAMFILAEKPDAAKMMAKAFKYTTKDGYYEIEKCPTFPDGAFLGYAVGHLVELFEPDDYDEKFKKWELSDLPIIPEQFKYKVIDGKQKAFNTIKKLANDKRVTEICIATDSGREGELIAISILKLAGVYGKKPIKRLWVSSMTPDAFRKGFQNLRDGSETVNYYYEAYSRSIADWLVGMNMTRAASILLEKAGVTQQGVFSVGRVQTPVLKIVVDREREIENFVSQPFWTIEATFNMNGKVYSGKWYKEEEGEKVDRFMDKSKAEEVQMFCENKPARITEVNKERKEVKPPKLFNLSALQTVAGRKFKYSPAKTLEIAQKLYINGYISYPRTESDAITMEEAKQFPNIFNKLKQFSVYSGLFPTPIKSEDLGSRYINPKRVTDHYALIPTEQVPDISKLSKDEFNIYDLIVRSVIAAHYNDAVFDHTSITTIVDEKELFATKGKVLVEEGWRKVIYPSGKEDDVEDEQGKEDNEDNVLLPDVVQNERGKVTDIRLKEGKTQPPMRFTESGLINVMKYAGRYINTEDLDEEALEKEMGKLSIGTEATRAGIIETLIERKFIEVKANKVYATEKAKILIDALGSKTILCSPELTGQWEAVLAKIGEGKFKSEVFIEKAKQLTRTLLKNIEESSKNWDFSSRIQQINDAKKIGTCPLCGGDVVDKNTFYGCQGYQTNGCTFRISHTIAKKKISVAQVKKLLQNGQTDIIKGFTSNKGKKFDTYLYWNEEKKQIDWGFNKDKAQRGNGQEIGICPSCGDKVVNKGSFYGCQGYQTTGCKFSINAVIAKKEIPLEQVKKLLTEGKTDVIKGFTSRGGENFDAFLFWNAEEKKIDFGFPEREKGASANKAIGVKCPFCGEEMVEHDSFIGCSGYKNGCKFTISKVYFGKKITDGNIKELLNKGKTELISGFVGKYGSFDGYLYIDKSEQKIKLKVIKKG